MNAANKTLAAAVSALAEKPPPAFLRQVAVRLWRLCHIAASAAILPPQPCPQQADTATGAGDTARLLCAGPYATAGHL